MKTFEAMSLRDLFDRRNEVWKRYFISVNTKDNNKIHETARELETIDAVLRVRIYG